MKSKIVNFKISSKAKRSYRANRERVISRHQMTMMNLCGSSRA
ncbi:hypothetical protein B8V81_1375 [Paenibacillus pasadenensis]|uniref:Uncharacterized protein n=1 Tax=Paenibacillus pasadenensis TaxID=217090 RepID=A0A2N5N9W1_9BACL|nr:hypothetical protein B8V81_1375 [Paenibacillus pasadenensis]